jgi:hypothetical protein
MFAFALFQFAAYALVALAGAALLALLRHRFSQRSLQNIPGPSNPSLFWGKLRRLEKDGSRAERTRRPWASYVQPLLCPLVPRRAIQDIRKSSTCLWFFGCTSSWQTILTDTWPHTQFYHWKQDIQLVVSDPKAFNNIIVKDQPIFEPTEATLRYVFPFE